MKVCLEVRVFCLFVERVAGLPTLRGLMRGCVCVYLSAVFQSEFIRLKAYLTMNSLLKSHSSTCSFLELILAQQELYLKVTAEYWMLSRKVGKVRPEAWSLIEGLLKCRGKLWGEGLELTFLSPTPTPRMLRGWEGQAAGDPENYHVQGETLSERLGLSAEVVPVDALLRCCAAAFSSCSLAWWCWKRGHTLFFVFPFLVRRCGAAGGVPEF